MNKYLFGLASASILAVSSSSYAFTPTPSTGGSVDIGNVTFAGTIINNSPAWEWRILPNTSSLQGIVVNELSGTSDGANNTVYTLVNSQLDLLEGRMKSAAANGGAGLTPSLTFNSQDIDNVNNSQTYTVNTNLAGVTLVIDVDKHMSVLYEQTGTGHFKRGNDAKAITFADSLIDATTQTSTWGGWSQINSNRNLTELNGYITDSSLADVRGTYGLTTSNITLVVPDSTSFTSSSTAWSASIPIAVTVN
ncbi:hypothetical protein ACMAZD_21820 [Vibrio sp. nBUS_14]|uniref:F4 family fimbrial subunit n=1 Tax=Vibrio sp. nBUS_14 TaxID=3395321 RepID=UPI003EBDD011